MRRFVKPIALVAAGLVLGGAAMAGATHDGAAQHPYTLCAAAKGAISYAPGGTCGNGQTLLRVGSAADMESLRVLVDIAMASELRVTLGPATPPEGTFATYSWDVVGRGLRPGSDVTLEIMYPLTNRVEERVLGEADAYGQFTYTAFDFENPGCGLLYEVTGTSARSDGGAVTSGRFAPRCTF